MCSRESYSSSDSDSRLKYKYNGRGGGDQHRKRDRIRARDLSANDINNNAEASRSLSQLLLPQLSTPSLCLVSGVLLVLVHALHFLEPSSSRSSYHGYHVDVDLLNQARSYQEGDSQHDAQGRRHPPYVLSSLLAVLVYIIQSPYIFYSLLLITVLLSLLILQYHRLRNIIDTTSPIPDLDIHMDTSLVVPNAHPYMGHYSYLLDPSKHKYLFTEHATPSGISAIWGPGLKRCASVLLAEHARLILRHNSQRDFSEWIVRHGRKTLGEDSLILINGGQRWKNVRKVVAKAFTNRIVRDGSVVVRECALEFVDWLKRACDGETETDSSSSSEGKCRGHGVNSEGKRTVCMEAENLFKLFSLNVFGRVAMGYDYQCIPKSNSSSNESNSNQSQQEQEIEQQASSSCSSSECSACCTCITTPPEALAFSSLEVDIGKRSSPISLLNPAMQFYWIPTKQNRTYHKNMDLVRGRMGSIIGQELEIMLSRGQMQNDRESSSTGCEKETEVLDESMQDDDDSINIDEVGETSTNNNMVTHLLKSCMEQHFSQPITSPSRRRSSASSGECPFASLSPSNDNSLGASASSFHGSNSSLTQHVPSPSEITAEDKQKIIQDVTKILHTLLSAGYETTALSLSYVMYCLSNNPRCQERACEEARRVLGRKRKSEESTTINNSDDDDEGLDNHDDKVEEDTIDDDDLPYCRAVFNESLRLHLPVLFTTRVLSKDLTLDTGYDEHDCNHVANGMPAKATLLKGTRVIVHPLMIHLDERNFERASEFLPERWVRWDESSGSWKNRDYDKESSISKDEQASTKMSPPPPFSDEYTAQHAVADTISAANPANFFSFSDGARNCVGRRLAIMEATILIAILFKDMCVSLGGGDDFELKVERKFVTVKPVSLPIKFWKR